MLNKNNHLRPFCKLTLLKGGVRQVLTYLNMIKRSQVSRPFFVICQNWLARRGYTEVGH